MSDPVDLDVLRYAATYGQAGEDEAPLFMAAADEVERLRDLLIESQHETAMAMRMHDVQFERANRLEAQLKARPARHAQ